MLAGEPILRTPDGERRLEPGDTVCFPSGAAGAHSVVGPGRVLMLSANRRSRRSRSTRTATSSGRGPADERPAELPSRRRGRLLGGRNVTVNLLAVEFTYDEGDPAGYHTGYRRVGPLLGAETLGLSVYELPPGQSICPYHYELGDEEWLVVLAGTPTLRTPEGERGCGPWDTVCFLEGAGRRPQGDEPHRRDAAGCAALDQARRRPCRSIPTATRWASGRPASCSASATPSTTGPTSPCLRISAES